MSDILLDCLQLSKCFLVNKLKLLAVNNVSLSLYTGSTLGIVGESGSGKSTLARLAMRLIEPDAGRILYKGQDITKLDATKLKDFRKNTQIVFQDTHSSLDPHWRIGASICEPLDVFGFSNRQKKQRLHELLDLVELPSDSANRFPHEFSGGQKQRIGIARALALNPSLIVLDEPVSALDISIQAQIINLLERLKHEFNLTYMLIAHDLAVVRHLSDFVAVMYLGQVVEYGRSDEVFDNPLHPYTKSLLSAVPKPELNGKINLLTGEIPSPINRPSGCVFHPRCPAAIALCKQSIPEKSFKSADSYVYCHLFNQEK